MTYNIIQHKGAPQRARTHKGKVITRQEYFWTQEYGMTKATDYDDHFIYENSEIGQSSFLCTCGSPAVIANIYGPDKMFVCLNHATFGFHQTSQVNKADYERGNPIIRKGKKWL